MRLTQGGYAAVGVALSENGLTLAAGRARLRCVQTREFAPMIRYEATRAMTEDQTRQVQRLMWLTSELAAGNEFSPELLLRWSREASLVLIRNAADRLPPRQTNKG